MNDQDYNERFGQEASGAGVALTCVVALAVVMVLLWLTFFISLAKAAEPPSPQTLVIIGCRVDDLTGQPGRHDPSLAAKGWRDLEWHQDPEDFSYSCKREVVPLQDFVATMDPTVQPLLTDFSNPSACGHVGGMYSPTWNEANPGWAVLAVGCPVRIETDGRLTGWKLPDCPSSIGGKNIKCKFDGSMI
jgi:hypothetical protein